MGCPNYLLISGMAKQVGPFKITGCYDHICFYKMDGEYYARMKSSLTGKRVKKDPAFRRTMEYAGLLGQASKIASVVYRGLTMKKREKGSYRKLTGQAMQLLKAGKTKEEILLLLQPGKRVEHKADNIKKKPAAPSFLFANEIFHQLFSAPLWGNEKVTEEIPP
jgi:hypothetical protein